MVLTHTHGQRRHVHRAMYAYTVYHTNTYIHTYIHTYVHAYMKRIKQAHIWSIKNVHIRTHTCWASAAAARAVSAVGFSNIRCTVNSSESKDSEYSGLISTFCLFNSTTSHGRKAREEEREGERSVLISRSATE